MRVDLNHLPSQPVPLVMSVSCYRQELLHRAHCDSHTCHGPAWVVGQTYLAKNNCLGFRVVASEIHCRIWFSHTTIAQSFGKSPVGPPTFGVI